VSNSIIIRFKPKGDKELIRALQALALAQARLEKNTAAVKRELRALGVSGALATRNLRNVTDGTTKGSMALSVFRSKLLLASFAVALFQQTLGALARKYIEQEKSERKLQQALGQTSVALHEYASALQQKTVYGDEDIINVQAQIAMFIKDENQIKKVTKATLDLAAAKGMDLKSAGDLMSKSIGSSTNALSRYGIQIDNSLRGSARLNAIVGETNKLFEGQAEAQGDTFGGSMAKASNALGDMAETLGESLAPLMAYFAEIIAVAATNLRDMFEWLGWVDSAADKISGDIIAQAAEWETLHDSLEGVNEQSAEFIRVRDKFIEQNPNYFDGLSKEEIKVKDLQEAIKLYNKYLLETIAVKLAELAMEDDMQALADLIAVRSERQQEANKLEMEFISKARALNKERLAEDFKNFKKSDEYRKASVDKHAQMEKTFIENHKKLSEKTLEEVIANLKKEEHFFKMAGKENWEALLQTFDFEAVKAIWSNILGGDDMTPLFDELAAYGDISLGTIDKMQEELVTKLGVTKEIATQLLQELEADWGDLFKGQDGDDIFPLGDLDKWKTMESQVNSMNQAVAGFVLSSQNGARTWKGLGDVIIQQLERMVATFVANWATFKIMEMFLTADQLTELGIKKPTFLNFHQGGQIQTHHNGGMIESYHQGGDVPIMAQEGEFVMRRSAVESIGLENLNRMNRTGQAGGVNINFSGNVLSGDFIENEAIPKIKDAVRRGADIGIS
tara:strand:- start:118 stop:2322 length:2205 start_codon:yes stop_codon:yes gene_type:complete